MAEESACSAYSAEIGSVARGAGGRVRPLGTARLVSPSISSSIESALLMPAMMLVPTGVIDAASPSSVIWNRLVAPSKIEAWPST
jgi:hypothetical protein